MSEKVKLPRVVAESLDFLVRSRLGGKAEVLLEHGNYQCKRPAYKEGYWEGRNKPLNNVSFDTLARALYIGYEVEETPEERVREFHNRFIQQACSQDLYKGHLVAQAISDVLDMLNIKIEGVNA